MNFEETEEAITLHGLGFCQVKLGGKQRLHVWHPALPRRGCAEYSSIHDHRFGFVSRVLVGVQLNHTFTDMPAGDDEGSHTAYLHEGPRTRFGNRPWIPDGNLFITHHHTDTIQAGGKYYMPPYVYHRTQPGGGGMVATIMTKVSEAAEGAHSLCKVGIAPDVDFDRKQWPADRLWEIVTEVLGRDVAKLAT